MSRLPRLLLACALVLSSCSKPPRPDRIILSYSEDSTSCLNCPSYRIDFHIGGLVHYECLRGCAAPGEQNYRVPDGRFDDLVRAFRSAHFFDIARTDPSRIVFDAPIIRLTYRDERRIYEVVDDARRNANIAKLEKRFKALTDVGRYNTPSLSLYSTLIAGGWDPNTVGIDQQNALASAVARRDLASTRFLLQHGSKITPRTFTYAAMNQNLELVRSLLESPNADLTPNTAADMLSRVAGSRSTDTLRYLLDRKLNPDLLDTLSGTTPLVSAILNDQFENADLLLARGANPNLSDPAGRRPLWAAARSAYPNFITLLLQHKADINAVDHQGETALIATARSCFAPNVKALLQAGADPTIQDKQGNTALNTVPQRGPVPQQGPNCETTRLILQQARNDAPQRPRH